MDWQPEQNLFRLVGVGQVVLGTIMAATADDREKPSAFATTPVKSISKHIKLIPAINRKLTF